MEHGHSRVLHGLTTGKNSFIGIEQPQEHYGVAFVRECPCSMGSVVLSRLY